VFAFDGSGDVQCLGSGIRKRMPSIQAYAGKVSGVGANNAAVTQRQAVAVEFLACGTEGRRKLRRQKPTSVKFDDCGLWLSMPLRLPRQQHIGGASLL
jgi:hypothetical protein